MGAVGSPQGGGGKKKGKKRKKRRGGFSLDMTPMVDVAFLLLTFFMLTTTFSKPQTMEINLPAKEFDVVVAQSNVLTLKIMEGNKVYWQRGENPIQFFSLYDTTGGKPGISKNFKATVEGQIAEVKQEVGQDVLALVLKLDKKAKYKNIVDVIDELNLMKMNRFSIAPMLDEDRALVTAFESGTPLTPEPPTKGGKK
ncbi:MAG: biopolymer transporter ExbD [Chloroherpetonaceae bacterium]|nr:biopolymer transporter ExbD [Chloroherpetonaceae bacterium]